jgi:hypothetical protein
MNIALVQYFLIVMLILNENISLILSQLVGSEKTMEQFLDRLLHESVYDRRIRPFYTDSKSNYNYSNLITIKMIFKNFLNHKDSKPVVVSMNMNINTISGISEVNMVNIFI